MTYIRVYKMEGLLAMKRARGHAALIGLRGHPVTGVEHKSCRGDEKRPVGDQDECSIDGYG